MKISGYKQSHNRELKSAGAALNTGNWKLETGNFLPSPRRIVWFVLTIWVAATIGMIVYWRAPGLSLQAQDGLMRLRGTQPVSDGIVIVAIDERSLARFGRFPWSRQVMARAIERITAAGPRAIALDVLYADPTEPEADQALAEAIARSGRVVVAAQLIRGIGDEPRAEWLGPLPAIEAAAIGHVNVSTDRDGVARTLLLRQADDDGEPRWAMALELLRVAEDLESSELRELPAGIVLGRTRIPADFESAPVAIEGNGIETVRASRLAVNYAGPAGSFATVSIADLIDGNVPAEKLRGRLVLIGATANALGDRLASPFTRHEDEQGVQHATLMPGVEILANAVRTISERRFIRFTPDWLAVMLSLMVAAGTILALGLAQGRAPVSLIALALPVVAVAVATYFAFSSFSIVLPVVPMLAAYLTAAPATLLIRSRMAGLELDSRILELTSEDRALGLPSADDSPAPMIARLTDARAVCLLERIGDQKTLYRLAARHGSAPTVTEESGADRLMRLDRPPSGSVTEALVREEAAGNFFGEPSLRAVTISLGSYGETHGALVIAYPQDLPPAPETLQVCREMASNWLASSPRRSTEKGVFRRLRLPDGPRGIRWKIRTLGKLQRMLLKRAGFIDRAMRSIEDGLLIAGVDGQVTFANPRAGQIFGLPEQALIGKNLFYHLLERAFSEPHDSDHERLNSILTRLLIDRAPVEREIVIGHAGERHFMLRLGAVCESDDGPLSGIVATLSDVTRQHELQQIKNDVLALVTHELRTPITAIQGMSEILAQHDYNPDERREMHQAINDESKRLSRLIDDYLDLARLESGARPLRRAAIRLTTLLERTLLMLEPVAKQRDIRLVRRFGINLPPITADADLLMQAANNLITNAIKYSPAGREVTIETGAGDDEVWIRVSDQGYGIPEQDLNHIFEKFYRVSRLEDAEVTGTGLGLPFVQEVAQLHGGRVTVESEVGVGSKFTMYVGVESKK